MAIILEGFDNSGKSTLASLISWPTSHPGPRPKDEVHESKCLAEQRLIVSTNVVMDRVTAISQMAYTGDMTQIRKNYAMEMAKNSLLIYCRPPIEKITDFSNHEVKSYDDEKWIRYIQDNCVVIVERYDSIMSLLPHIVYDWTDESSVRSTMHLINIYQGNV